jgi:hypothetical protein
LVAVSSETPSEAAREARRGQARHYTWRRCAEATMRAYAMAMG